MAELDLAPEFQAVPLVGFETEIASVNLSPSVLHSELPAGSHEGHWRMVRAGHGIVAPEYGWNDYAGLDVDGAVVVVEAGEPTAPGVFEGDALTLHGRWTTKLDRARERGAAGCLIEHNEDALYPWSTVQASFEAERFALAPGPEPALALWGWLAAAPASDTLDVRFEQRTRTFAERNVLTRVGSGHAPFVVVTAHWDHLGRGPDGVFNGAMDNASGVAALLALADAVKRRHDVDPLAGTVVFAATAAEEVGLLGSEVLAASLPSDAVVAAINFDGMNVGPITPTIELVAPGLSTLDDLFGAALRVQGRRALPDQSPRDGAAFRSDHLPFARRDIPVLYPQPGYSEVTAPETLAFARERSRRYHTTEDDYDPRWSFDGVVADVRAVYEAVIELAEGEVRPRMR